MGFQIPFFGGKCQLMSVFKISLTTPRETVTEMLMVAILTKPNNSIFCENYSKYKLLLRMFDLSGQYRNDIFRTIFELFSWYASARRQLNSGQ